MGLNFIEGLLFFDCRVGLDYKLKIKVESFFFFIIVILFLFYLIPRVIRGLFYYFFLFFSTDFGLTGNVYKIPVESQILNAIESGIRS